MTNRQKKCKISYTVTDLYLLYGAAMVSTGVVKYDKRSAPDNRVKMSKLKQKTTTLKLLWLPNGSAAA